MSLFLGVAAGAAIAAPSPSSGASDIVPVIPDPLSGKEEQVTKLPNGLSVLILKDTRFPLVSTRLYVHAGSSYETPDQAGISHVLEHMVFKGTDSRPKSAISQEVESAGGYLNAATSYDYTVYITDMPDRHWKLGMDVVRDMAFHPTLDPQELESEKNVIVAELQRGEDDPGSRMFKTLLADTLKGTPYDRPIIGYEKTIRALTTQNLRDYIAKYYQPQNMLLVVVGNVDPAEVLAEAEKMFAPYKNTAPLKEVMPYEADRLPLPGSKPALVVQPGPWNKVYLAAALPVPGSSSYQSATLDVLAYLLGGDRTSLFYKTYKYERQLVDSISVSNVGFERIGAFVVTAPAFSKDETARGIKDQLAAIKSREDQPLGLAFRKLPPFLFPGSVYGYLQLGEPENVQKYDEAQLRSFWNRQKARPWVLAVSGDFDRDQILAFAKSLPAPDQRKVDVPVPAWGTRPELDIPMPGRNQAHLMLIFKTAPDTSPDTPALDLLETSLGGMGGPLFRDLRDKQGLGYTVTAFNRQTSENGYMVFYIGTEPGKMAQAEEGFKRIINDLHQNLLSEEDVNRGKNQLEGDYYRNMQSLGSRSGEAAALTMEGYPLSFTKDQIEKSKNVTPEQLREIVKKYLDVDSAYTIKVLP